MVHRGNIGHVIINPRRHPRYRMAWAFTRYHRKEAETYSIILDIVLLQQEYGCLLSRSLSLTT